jgi:hypothetical protein
LIITLVFKKNAKFLVENWEKSQKIVIITSTPGTHVPKFSHRFDAYVVGMQTHDHNIWFVLLSLEYVFWRGTYYALLPVSKLPLQKCTYIDIKKWTLTNLS